MSVLRQTVRPGVLWIAIAIAAAMAGAWLKSSGSSLIGNILLYGSSALAVVFLWEVVRVLRLRSEGLALMRGVSADIATKPHLLAAYNRENQRLMWARASQVATGDATIGQIDREALKAVMNTNQGEPPEAFASLLDDYRLLLASKERPSRESISAVTSAQPATKPIDEQTIRRVDFGKHFYLVDYRQHYSEFLNGVADQERVLSELFLFRGWATQFGFRVFNSHQHLIDSILDNIVSSATTLGVGLFKTTHGFDPQDVLGGRLIDLIESRWQAYDEVIEKASGDPPIPIPELVHMATELMNVRDAGKVVLLSADVSQHIREIKNEASAIGLF